MKEKAEMKRALAKAMRYYEKALSAEIESRKIKALAVDALLECFEISPDESGAWDIKKTIMLNSVMISFTEGDYQKAQELAIMYISNASPVGKDLDYCIEVISACRVMSRIYSDYKIGFNKEKMFFLP